MIEIHCPWCGPRVSGEFVYEGSTGDARPDPATVSIAEWRGYLYGTENPPGWVDEHWLHLAGCGEIVAVRRHRLTNEVAPAPACQEGQPQ